MSIYIISHFPSTVNPTDRGDKDLQCRQLKVMQEN